MTRLISGKVARILSEKLVVINVGADAGVTLGMPFVVLALGEEVTDPESGDVLGRWEAPKGYVRAVHVQERMTTCEGFAPDRPAAGGEDPSTDVLSAALIAHSMHPETWRVKVSPLNVNRAEMAGRPVVGPICVGDPVRQLDIQPPVATTTEDASE